MTRKCVDDDKYGRLWRRLDELARRVDEGTVDVHRVMEILKHTIEGKMDTLLSTGGVVLSDFLPLTLETLERTTLQRAGKLDEKGCTVLWVGKKSPKDWTVFSSLSDGDATHELNLNVGVMRYVRFSDADEVPGTKRILRDMQDLKVRPGTANQFLEVLERYPDTAKKWGKYIVALGSTTKKGGQCLRYEADRFNRTFGTLDFMGRLASWWPSCYSFFVTKEV